MNTQARHLLDEALKLPVESREDLAVRLLDSVEPTEAEAAEEEKPKKRRRRSRSKAAKADVQDETVTAEVAEAALHALFDENPKRRYMVVPNERQAEITVRKAMEEMVQLNQGQKYSYDRETLIRMLDEAMAANP